MPFTYTPNDAITLVKSMVKNCPVSAIQIQACDLVNSAMWIAAPFQWTRANIAPSIPLVDGVQDFTVPSQFYRLLSARITRTDITPNYYQELDPIEWIPPELTQKMGYTSQNAICYETTFGMLRLTFPISVPSGVTLQIDGEYQMFPTRITSFTLGTNFWFPDQYFPVFVDGLQYYFYKFTDDARAGTVQIVRGQRMYTGQFGVFHDSLLGMCEAEDLKNGQGQEFPAEPFGMSAARAPIGIFGY